MDEQVLLYLPVIHAGYEAFLDRHRSAREILLIGSSVIAQFPVLAKEIRALAPERAAQYLAAVAPAGQRVRVVEADTIAAEVSAAYLIVPDEEVTRGVVGAYGLAVGRDVQFERTFLRWDREWSRAQRPLGFVADAEIAEEARRFVAEALKLADGSSDWWRQVGAIAVRDGNVLYSEHNRHAPTEYAPYFNGDPRNNFRRGVSIELSTATHAEAAIVAGAARDGVSLAGADLYVSTFPCPGCARLVAVAGFRRCVFAGPYSMLDGEDVLRSAGVELVWVDAEALAGTIEI
jgi:dCMP deaminase